MIKSPGDHVYQDQIKFAVHAVKKTNCLGDGKIPGKSLQSGPADFM